MKTKALITKIRFVSLDMYNEVIASKKSICIWPVINRLMMVSRGDTQKCKHPTNKQGASIK